MSAWDALAKEQRVQVVGWLSRKPGMTAKRIADDLGTTAATIHAFARDESLTIETEAQRRIREAEPIGTAGPTNHDLWAASDDLRREAIMRRAARGARERLAEIAQEERTRNNEMRGSAGAPLPVTGK